MSFLVSSCVVVKYFRPMGAAAALSHVGSASLFGFGFSAALQSLKSVKTDALFSKWAAILKLLFWLVMSEQTKEGMLLNLLNCRVDVLWNRPHGRSSRGVGRAWYQSSVVLLFMPGWKAPPYGRGWNGKGNTSNVWHQVESKISLWLTLFWLNKLLISTV